jgi:hypothetical protein
VGTVGLSADLDASFLHIGKIVSDTVALKQSEIASGIEKRLGIVFDARNVVFACLASVHSRADREFRTSQIKQKLHRAAIHASIIQGASLTEAAIATARYAQAGALVRQEIEAVEGLRGLRQEVQQDGSTPRLKALRHLGRSYANLSALAHLSKFDLMMETVDLLQNGIDPTLNKQLEEQLFCLHLVALVSVCHDASELRPHSKTDYLSEQEQLWLSSVCGLLAEKGYLKIAAN